MKAFALIPFIFMFSSCSLRYSAPPYNEGNIPEFVFENTVFTRVTDGKTMAKVKSDLLEQYRSSLELYARNVAFKAYNEEGGGIGEGSGDYVFYDNLHKKCILFGNIKIREYKNDLFITACQLKWDEKSRQLVGGEEGKVSIEGKNMKFIGKGFSFSSISCGFAFSDFELGESEEEEK